VRRVLILENPGLRGQSAVTQSLYAGLQLILPGEVAPSHRHTQSACASSSRAAARTRRSTASAPPCARRLHHHAQLDLARPRPRREGPVVWLDGLDIPTIRFFDAGFAENGGSASQAVSKAEGSSFARFGHNMAPVRHEAPFGATSPIFSYPYERTLEALHRLERDAPIDPGTASSCATSTRSPAAGRCRPWAPSCRSCPPGSPARAGGRPMARCTAWSRERARSTSRRAAALALRALAARSFRGAVMAHCPAQFAPGCVLFSYSDRPVHQALAIHKEERLS
jgi:gentisate 1,2-dioxygenase